MKLAETPPKDGMSQDYDCGLNVLGSWAGRLEQHNEFIESKAGKYILYLEGTAAELERVKADLEMLTNYISMKEFDESVLRNMVAQIKEDGTNKG